MKIGKISGSDYRSLGVSETTPFKKKNAVPLFVYANEDRKDEIQFNQKRKAQIKENLPEAGVLLTSILVGGIILYGLFGGKRL